MKSLAVSIWLLGAGQSFQIPSPGKSLSSPFGSTFAVPFFDVEDVEASLGFFVGEGFEGGGEVDEEEEGEDRLRGGMLRVEAVWKERIEDCKTSGNRLESMQ